MDYNKFINSKRKTDPLSGLTEVPDLNPALIDFQKDVVAWALRRARAAIFADCGMGKTFMQLEWAKHVPGRVLIIAPLAVSLQTISEGVKFGFDVKYSGDGSPLGKITITNYERIHKFDPSDYVGVVLDESGILKSYTGKYKQELVARWSVLHWKLAATATPAPNDYMELGNHAEFLGIMTGSEMLASFFINDPGHVGHYRIKGHAETPFWKWMASWAAMIRRPSDLGYDDGKFILPECTYHDIVLDSHKAPDGFLFAVDAHTMMERKAARRATVGERVAEVIRLANSTDDEWMVWCDRNDESAQLTKGINGAVEVKGSDTSEHKEGALLGFAKGDFRVLVSKPKIAGWGMNYQHCRNVAFTGLSDSYEQFYQAVRRCWRFGQERPVNVYTVTDRTEGAVVANVRRKGIAADRMAEEMTKHMAYISRKEIRGDSGFAKSYKTNTQIQVTSWLNA